MTTRDLALTALFAALTAVCAQIALTLPLVTGVPFTLQVLAVLASGAIIGARRGFLSQILYLLLGAVGLPVFGQMHGGLGVLLGPTGGYLWSFPLAALAVGWTADAAFAPGGNRRRPAGRLYAGMAVGIAIIYASGVAGLYVSGAVPTLRGAVRVGVLPFLWFDLLKAYVAVLVAMRVRGAVVRAERALV